MLEPR